MSARSTEAGAPAGWLRRWANAWLARRTGSEAARITLDRRRLFVLPTWLGYTFGATLLLLLIGSLNYSASLGFALTFLLAGCGAVGMLHTYRNLACLTLTFAPAAPVFAGETARFPVELQAPARDRWAIELTVGDQAQTLVTVAPGTPTHAQLPVASRRRGRLGLPRVRVTTYWPLLLFRVWSPLRPDLTTLVYPAPVDHGHARPSTLGSGSGGSDPGADEFAGLRDYQPGDPPRRIAWKALARTDELRVKDFDTAAEDEAWLDWARLDGLGHEARLEQLCAWVMAADRGGQPYGLLLPGTRIAPGTGPAHRARCLEALALADGAAVPG